MFRLLNGTVSAIQYGLVEFLVVKLVTNLTELVLSCDDFNIYILFD